MQKLCNTTLLATVSTTAGQNRHNSDENVQCVHVDRNRSVMKVGSFSNVFVEINVSSQYLRINWIERPGSVEWIHFCPLHNLLRVVQEETAEKQQTTVQRKRGNAGPESRRRRKPHRS